MTPTTPEAVRGLTDTFYLAFVVWREARGESRQAQEAVAWSVLNRVTRPGWWGSNVSEVVTKKWQYSSLTDTKDPQLTRWPLATDGVWIAAVDVARAVLAGAVTNPVPGADSYYDTSIAPPAWTRTARPCGRIGRLVFWDVDHDVEAPQLVAAAEQGVGVSQEFEQKLRAFLS